MGAVNELYKNKFARETALVDVACKMEIKGLVLLK